MSKSSKSKGGGDSLYKGMGIKLENIVIGDTLGAFARAAPIFPSAAVVAAPRHTLLRPSPPPRLLARPRRSPSHACSLLQLRTLAARPRAAHPRYV